MAARALPSVKCNVCGGEFYSRDVQHGAAVQYRCPRCHIHIRLPAGFILVTAPFVERVTVPATPAA